MTSARFARMRRLLLAVADLAPDVRRAYLDDACGDDPDLRREVEAIVAHDEDSSGLLESDLALQILGGEKGLAGPQPPHDHSPPELPGYRIVRRLGEGGMGVVYEAEQQSPRRVVAVKVVRGGGCVDDQRVRLFQREIEALARLKHPSIAAIYDAGCTVPEHQFFAMELVQGTPLEAYVDRHPTRAGHTKADVRTCLELFLEICQAISYAHQRGVIHRDLKPSNIVVVPGDDSGQSGSSRASPRIKILDFGLARLIDDEATVATRITCMGQIQGTLAYMSPEQARGELDAIDVRSDVYALGIILYELVTGQHPYDVHHARIHEAVRVICEERPKRPGSIDRVLRGDLETIVLKALAKEPSRRYQSAAALAEDVERLLTDQPILARPPSTTYQLQKLVARHKGACVFAATVLMLLTAFAVIMSVMYGQQRQAHREARAERDRAVREAERADRTSLLLQEMFTSDLDFEVPAEPLMARRGMMVRELLDATCERIERNPSAHPETQAALLRTIGKAYQGIGAYEASEPLLEQALTLRRAALGARHEDVAQSVDDLGWLYHDRGAYENAEVLVRQALDIRRELFGPENLTVAQSLVHLGDLARHRGSYREAETHLREALAVQTRLLGREHGDVAATLRNLALTLQNAGDDGAGPLYGEALALTRKLFGDKHPETIANLNRVGSVLMWDGDYEAAEPLLRESLDGYRRIFGDTHATVAAATNDLALLYSFRGEYARSEPLFRESLALRRELFGPDHPNVAYSLTGWGEALIAGGQPAEAESLLREARGLWDTLPPGDWRWVSARRHLVNCLSAQGRYEEAERLALETDALVRSAGSDVRARSKTLSCLVELYAAWGKPGAAEAHRAELAKLGDGEKSGATQHADRFSSSRP